MGLRSVIQHLVDWTRHTGVWMMDWSREEVLKKEVEELQAQLQVSLQELYSGTETFLQTCSMLQQEAERNQDLWEQVLQATQNLQQERTKSSGQMFLYQKERLHLYHASLLKMQLESASEDLEDHEHAVCLLSEEQVRASHRQLQDRYNEDVQNVRQRNANLEKSLEMQIELHACEVMRYEEMDARLRSELEDLRRILEWEVDRAAHREAALLQEVTKQQRGLHDQEEQPTAAPQVPVVGSGATEGGGGRASRVRSMLRLGLVAGVMAAGLTTLRLVNKPLS